MRTYHGVVHGHDTASSHAVFVIEEDNTAKPLDPRLDLERKSPAGFNWSYHGSGPAQLALALCADALPGDPDRALRIYQRFKARHVATLPAGLDWTMTSDEVRARVLAIEREELARDALNPLPCRNCKGAGWDDGRMTDCEDCKGTGNRPEPEE